MPRARLLLAAAVAAATSLTACGGRDDTFRTDRPIVRFELGEYRIAPQDVHVPAGRIKIEAKDVGRLAHNLVVQVPAASEDEEPVEKARIDTLQPGESGSAKVSLAAGTYTLVCTIANHDDLGQYGELHVEG